MNATEFDIKDYRQPMVTSIGINLGFLIAFLGNWVTENTFKLKGLDDKIIFFGAILGSSLLFFSLFRMLTIPPGNNILKFYRQTLTIYITGVVIAFSSILLSVFF